MPVKLIAESGSTKTDWVVLKKGKVLQQFKTAGINPYLQKTVDIMEQLEGNFKLDVAIDEVYFYGAGINSKANARIVTSALKNLFGTKKVAVESDILAAARGLSQDKKGMICILGTGSNCCYYDGKKIKDQLPSLGYIAGDEGSGNHMGKRILQYYAYNTFDTELRMYFEEHIGNDIGKIITKLYKEPFPNRFLAAFVKLLVNNRGHFMVENIIEDSFNEFFHQHLLKYRQSWKSPIYFTGSIAYVFSDVLETMCSQYEFELGSIIQNPMEGLIEYHK
ncbi:MAG: N-acetylglucosamine kinase [Chitinophagaceae bacterium]|jgi:N-acetylglucosamine kinase-like BadF-type ATPase